MLKRGGIIILLGLLLHGFPFYPLSRLTDIRIPGVLQRIGVCYIAAALLSRGRSSRAVVVQIAVLLLGYWLLQALVAPPGVARPTLEVPADTLSAWLDRKIFGSHLWSVSKTWDPEGLLSTLPAVGTCLSGILAGRWLVTSRPLAERLNGLFAVGSVAMVVGLMWHWVFPINKNLWTSSYVVFTSGMAAGALATAAWAVEGRGWSRWAGPLVTYGLNPIVAFWGSGAMARLLGMIRVRSGEATIPHQQAIFERGFAPWAPPRAASLLYATSFVLLWFLILKLLERRGLVIKV